MISEKYNTSFFHSFILPDGETILGDKPLIVLQQESDVIFKHDVENRTVLDLAAWDGYFSFEAEKRGAKDVLASDWYCWDGGPGWGTKAGFDIIHKAYKSHVRSLEVDILDLDPVIQGTFDTVLCLGVLYHTKDPFLYMKKVAEMSHDHVVIESATAFDALKIPAARAWRHAELNNDPTNYWSPNIAMIEGIMRDNGFNKFEFIPHPSVPCLFENARHIVHCWR